ncbi:hypothetical protein E2C01_063971 [Portunus trituberculatus]|uniref:Uncharacterized protein n=1 Tax=Portunus trituberculatus TaxID=210409 RepID=A0A5B7HBW6_PORTR|nr:hypothetical protein [Portunus trituberculatus]
METWRQDTMSLARILYNTTSVIVVEKLLGKLLKVMGVAGVQGVKGLRTKKKRREAARDCQAYTWQSMYEESCLIPYIILIHEFI